MGNNFFKGAMSLIIMLIVVVIAWKLLKFAIAVVLPIAIIAFVAYVIYIAVTGRRA